MRVNNHSVEFRVDGYSIMDMEVCDDTALVHVPNPLGVEMLIEFDDPRKLLDACMKMHGIQLCNVRDYAELMLSAGMMEWVSYRQERVVDEGGVWYPWGYRCKPENYEIAWA